MSAAAPENEDPGALAGATGAPFKTTHHGNLGADYARGTVLQATHFLDPRSHSVEPLHLLREVSI